MSARDVKSAVPKRQKGSVPDEKEIFAVFFALLVLCTAVVTVFADEADDWDFPKNTPPQSPPV